MIRLDTAESAADFVEWVPVEGVRVDDEGELLKAVQRFVFEQQRPGAYVVELRHKLLEQGGSSSLGEFVIELMANMSEEAWRALAASVATFIADWISGSDDEK